MKRIVTILVSAIVALGAVCSCVSAPNSISTPTPTPIATATPTPTPIPQEEECEVKYIGNVNSKKLHDPECHKLPAEKNRVDFYSFDDAIDEGYSPCKLCNPA